MAIDCALWLSVVFLVCNLCLWSVQAMQCKGTANYTLTFQGEWSNASRPKDYPSNANFSYLVGCSHNASYVMWRPGEKATTGVKNFAETGGYVELHNEIDDQIASTNAYKRYHDGSMIHGTANRTITNIEVNPEYPLVSFISKISPSPDWFVGVHDYNLCNTITGEWIESTTRDLLPYDAGTDSGRNFESVNNRTTPAEKIYRITNNTEGSFKGDKPVKSLAFVTFSKTPPPPNNQTTTKQNVPTTLPKPTLTSRGSRPKNATSSVKLAASVTANPMSAITPTSSVSNKRATSSVKLAASVTANPTSTITPTSSVSNKRATSSVKLAASVTANPTSTITPTSSVSNKRATSSVNHDTTQPPQPMSTITPTSSAVANKIALSSVKHGTTQKPNPTSKTTPTSNAATIKSAVISSVKHVSTHVATTKPTSSAESNVVSSVKQFGLIHVVFVLILNFLL